MKRIKKRKLQIKEVEMNGKLPEIRLNVPLENTIGEISDNISLVFNEIPLLLPSFSHY